MIGLAYESLWRCCAGFRLLLLALGKLSSCLGFGDRRYPPHRGNQQLTAMAANCKAVPPAMGSLLHLLLT